MTGSRIRKLPLAGIEHGNLGVYSWFFELKSFCQHLEHHSVFIDNGPCIVRFLEQAN